MENFNQVMESFIAYCDKMKVATEEKDANIPSMLRKNKDLRRKYKQAISQLTDDIRSNRNGCVDHAIGKHNDEESAWEYAEKADKDEVVSYMDRPGDLIKYCLDIIRMSGNDIESQLFSQKNKIIVSGGFDMPIGKGIKNKKLMKETFNALRIVIKVTGYSINGVPILLLKTIYPIPNNRRNFN